MTIDEEFYTKLNNMTELAEALVFAADYASIYVAPVEIPNISIELEAFLRLAAW